VYKWPPRFRLGFWMLVQYSLGALAFSLLPSLARDFGITSWSGPVVLLALFQFASCVHFLRRHMLLERAGNPSRSRTLWFAGSVTMLLTPAVLAWSLFGGLGGPTYHLYHFGVAVCLLASLGAFVGFLRLDPRANSGAVRSRPPDGMKRSSRCAGRQSWFWPVTSCCTVTTASVGRRRAVRIVTRVAASAAALPGLIACPRRPPCQFTWFSLIGHRARRANARQGSSCPTLAPETWRLGLVSPWCHG
jgi:hypothetical protein